MNNDPKAENEDPFLHVDPLKDTYRESVIEVKEHIQSLKESNTALLVIDVQYLDAAEGHGVFADVARSGVPLEAQKYYFNQLREIVLPNIRRLQDCFRSHGMEVIHTRIQSLTQDGRDRGAGHKRLNLHAPPGSKDAEFLPEVAPVGDEIIINKTSSGVFPTTNLSYVLNNLEIDALYTVGVYTNECVSSTVRGACDLGFHVTLIEDACTTVTPELQEFSLAVLRDRYALIMNTDDAIREIDQTAERKKRAQSPGRQSAR